MRPERPVKNQTPTCVVEYQATVKNHISRFFDNIRREYPNVNCSPSTVGPATFETFTAAALSSSSTDSKVLGSKSLDPSRS